MENILKFDQILINSISQEIKQLTVLTKISFLNKKFLTIHLKYSFTHLFSLI